jgi:hypothetical protein
VRIGGRVFRYLPEVPEASRPIEVVAETAAEPSSSGSLDSVPDATGGVALLAVVAGSARHVSYRRYPVDALSSARRREPVQELPPPAHSDGQENSGNRTHVRTAWFGSVQRLSREAAARRPRA